MKLSVVMPAQNEEGSVGATVEGVVTVLDREGIDYEVLVIDDGSEDTTPEVVAVIAEGNPRCAVARRTMKKVSGWRSGRVSISSRATRS